MTVFLNMLFFGQSTLVEKLQFLPAEQLYFDYVIKVSRPAERKVKKLTSLTKCQFSWNQARGGEFKWAKLIRDKLTKGYRRL